MTTVAIWYEPHDDCAWMTADTRVSHTTPSAGTITDSAVKIFQLSVTCFQPAEDGFFRVPVYSSSIGFAYAGSTLPALMTYAVVNSCLQNLVGLPGSVLPNLANIAALVSRVSNKYLVETMSPFELAILGWCPVETRYRAFLVKPNGSPLQMHLSELPIYEPEHVALLGNHQEAVQRAIQEVYAQLQGQDLKRAPKLALQRLVSSNSLRGHRRQSATRLSGSKRLSALRMGPTTCSRSPRGWSISGWTGYRR